MNLKEKFVLMLHILEENAFSQQLFLQKFQITFVLPFSETKYMFDEKSNILQKFFFSCNADKCFEENNLAKTVLFIRIATVESPEIYFPSKNIF